VLIATARPADLDECESGKNTCDPDATCGYDCECNEDYEGDGFSCQGSKELGEVCEEASACASGLCLTDVQCTVECSLEESSYDCGDQGYHGLCVQTDNEDILDVCALEIKAGNDKDDDRIVLPGETINPSFQSIDDIDVHMVKLGAGEYDIIATPNPDDDIAVIFYNIDGSLLAEQNMGSAGDLEGVNLTSDGAPLYVIVANIGDNIGSYTLEVIQK